MPLQRPHGVAVTIWPRIDWRTRWIWPEPRQSGQVLGARPFAGAAAGTGRAGHRRLEVHLATGAEDGLCEADLQHDLGVGTLAAAAAGAAGAEKPWLKKTSNRSPRPPANPNVSPAPAPAPVPRTPSGPNMS